LGDGKKAINGKLGLASKAAPAGVQKLSRTNSSRSALGVKDNNVKPKPTTSELKRHASGSGVLGNIQKKRAQTSNSNVQSSKEATPNIEEPPRKKSCSEPEIKSSKAEAQVLEDAKATAQAFQDAITDLDAEDLDDPLMVAEYVQEIFEYYKQLEEITMPNPEYMEHQDDLDWSMRGVLVDWLIEVHTRFRLLPETLFLAVNIVDRFLSSKVVPLDKFQLVGVTAMFIASKYEEVLSPHIGNFVHVADNGFTVDEVLAAERYTLTALKYDLSYPNPMNFLRRISKADNYDIHTRTIGKYLMEISLLDHRFMPYRQSHIAAAAMYLSRLILEKGPWVSHETFPGGTRD
jgi:G2/mitotic-specific cyclin 2